MTFEWENGRILKKISTSDKSVQMSYDSNGMRTQKTVDGVKTNYYYDSNKNLIALVKGNDTLLFYYDSDGSATSFSYNGTMYFYVKNLQGDVIRIIDLAGTEVASYVYDAWGNIKDTKGEPKIREINPIRYRGYVYDTETSLYYLQSRYYDPFTGRFLNADIYCDANTGTSLSTNMFAYCENNPVQYKDSNGHSLIVIAASWALRLSIMMYEYAAVGARFNNNIQLNNWWDPIGSAMRSRLKSSSIIKSRVNKYIKNTSSKKKTYSKKEAVYFNKTSLTADLDLKYAVGHASDCTIKVTRTDTKQWFTGKRKYVVQIKLSDVYDFKKFTKKDAKFVTRSINNYFGYYPQEWGILKKYSWSINYSYDYYK